MLKSRHIQIGAIAIPYHRLVLKMSENCLKYINSFENIINILTTNMFACFTQKLKHVSSASFIQTFNILFLINNTTYCSLSCSTEESGI